MTIWQRLGFRTMCCNKRFYYKWGWDERYDGWACTGCDRYR